MCTIVCLNQGKSNKNGPPMCLRELKDVVLLEINAVSFQTPSCSWRMD